MATSKQEKKPAIRVTTKQEGFRRGGREWHGTTELSVEELTSDQLAQIKGESKLVVEDIELIIEDPGE